MSDVFPTPLMAIVGAGLGTLILSSIIKDRRALNARKGKNDDNVSVRRRFLAHLTSIVVPVIHLKKNILNKIAQFNDSFVKRLVGRRIVFVFVLLRNLGDKRKIIMLFAFFANRLYVGISQQLTRIFALIIFFLFPARKV